MKEGVNGMFKIIEYNGEQYKLSHSKYLQFITYAKAIMKSSWTNSDKKAAVERYLNMLIN